MKELSIQTCKIITFLHSHGSDVDVYILFSADHVTYSQSDPSIWSHDCCFKQLNAHFSVH